MIRLSGDRAEIIDNVHTGALTSEKGNIIKLQADMMRVRRRMLWNGVVTVSVVFESVGQIMQCQAFHKVGLLMTI